MSLYHNKYNNLRLHNIKHQLQTRSFYNEYKNIQTKTVYIVIELKKMSPLLIILLKNYFFANNVIINFAYDCQFHKYHIQNGYFDD